MLANKRRDAEGEPLLPRHCSSRNSSDSGTRDDASKEQDKHSHRNVTDDDNDAVFISVKAS